MFKNGQLAKTKRSRQHVIVTKDEDEYGVVAVFSLIRRKHGYVRHDNLELIGNNFKFKGAK